MNFAIILLSSGIPAMAAVWVIVSKTRFPATLIESSRLAGVTVASVPFDISAEFIPDLLQWPDEKLKELAAGQPPKISAFKHIVHRSRVMKRIVAKARLIAPRSVPVMIEGESGTGKELPARAIHDAIPRKDKPFMVINCGAIAPTLLESELFDHVKGAFTGADKQKKGCFEMAHTGTGTLFPDEIGELTVEAQVKLLRVVQEKEIVRVGVSTPKKVDVRVVAATNRVLVDEVSTGRFRSDLFYRIAVAVLKLPPLRERSGDIGLLINHLLRQFQKPWTVAQIRVKLHQGIDLDEHDTGVFVNIRLGNFTKNSEDIPVPSFTDLHRTVGETVYFFDAWRFTVKLSPLDSPAGASQIKSKDLIKRFHCPYFLNFSITVSISSSGSRTGWPTVLVW